MHKGRCCFHLEGQKEVMRSGLNFIAQQQGSSKVGLLAGGLAGAKNGEMQ